MTNNITEIQFINTFGQVGPQGKIVVDTNTQMAINFAVSDIKDPFSRKGTKSYKFTVLGTKENNQLLNNYYDINILDGTYNHNHKQRVAILRNGIVVVDNAYMQLLAINKTAVNGTYNDQVITYEVEIGNGAASFFADITNKYLTDLNFSDMNHDYNSTNVIASFTNNYSAASGGGYKYVLPYIAGTEYVLEELHPAISVYEYWNRIHQAAGYTWDWDLWKADSVRMDRLWIPYNGETPSIDTSIYEVAVENSTAIGYLNVVPGAVAGNIFPIGTTLANEGHRVNLDTVIKDLEGDWVVSTPNSFYDASLFFGISTLDFAFEITYSFELENTSAGNAYWIDQTGNILLSPLESVLQYDVFFKWDLSQTSRYIFEEITEVKTNQALGIYTLAPGWNTILSSHTVTTPWYTIPGIQNSNILYPRIGAYRPATALNGFNWRDNTVNGNLVLVNPRMFVSSIKLIMKPRFETYAYATHLQMNSFVPKQVKQSDLIKGICNMFNLIVEVDPTNDRRILYKHRDSYYDTGVEKDWTSKFVTEKESKVTFISDPNKKKVILTYKEDKDLHNVKYTGITKEVYGQLEYELENKNIKDVDKKEILFSPTPIELTTFDAYVPAFDNPRAPKTNIRILLCNDNEVPQTCKVGYKIIDYGGLPGDPNAHSDNSFIWEYPMLTHQDDPRSPMFDINFGLCDFYFFPFVSQTNNNLYSMFWRRTINQIDTGKMLTCYLQLDEYDISILRMSDKIWIKDTWYNINSLTYDPNSTGPSKVVLTTIDYQLKLYPSKGPAQQSSVSSHYDIISRINETRKDYLNYNYSDGTALALGTGNIISENIKNILVVGNNITPEMSNAIYTDNLIATNIYNLNAAGNITTLNQINNVVEILYADLAALKAAGELIPNTTYFIIDRGYWVTAATVDRLDTFGKRIMNIPLSSMYVPSGTILGIWQSTLTPTSGDTVVWGGQAWKNLTGTVGSFISNSDLDATNWAPRLHYDLSYYEDKIFLIQYDFDNDWISRQADDRENVLGFWDSTFTTPNPVDITDWNDLSIKNNTNFGGIFNNAIVNGIYNNLNAGSIYNNNSNGIIFNNSNSSHIYGNVNNGDINNNTNTGEISFNFNSGRISANSNIGDITFNSNNGGILVNTNVGTIDFNSAPVTTILRNSNNGYISSNSNTGNIENNSNTANINNNSNIGGILSNSSVGGIFDNTNNGRIFSNSNLGTITTNSNNGEITLNANTESIDTNSNDGDIIHNLNNGTIYLNSNIGAIIANSNGGNILQNSTIGEIELNVNSKDIGPNTQTSGTCKIKFNNNNGDISGARTVDVLGTVVNI